MTENYVSNITVTNNDVKNDVTFQAILNVRISDKFVCEIDILMLLFLHQNHSNNLFT